jgi:AraC-like DNA-binding protein
MPPGPVPDLPRTRSQLWLPPLGLAACVRAGISRDTTGVALDEAQRQTHFPASPLVSLTWWLLGSGGWCELPEEAGLARGSRMRCPLPVPLTLAGPFTGPSLSACDGPVHTFALMLHPDAFHVLTGLDPRAHVNRLCDGREVLPPDWRLMAESVRQAASDAARWALIEAFLRPRWQAVRARQAWAEPATGRPPRYREWAEALALRAAQSASGRSVRQWERRVRQWAGLPMREIRVISRGEQAFFAAMRAQAAGPSVNWAEVALDGGYADQSHLCRETRRMTGFSPEELRRQINEDERFWLYRLWGLWG